MCRSRRGQLHPLTRGTIGSMVAHLEVSAHRSADWERAILVGYQAWRHLRDNGGGAVELNMEQQTLAVI
jgi:hypothetical protein